MTVLLTGGSGVVGRAVLRHLLQQGRKVKALARSDRAAGSLQSAGAVAVTGDVTDYRSLLNAMSGAQVVYHVAGLNQMCARRSDEMMKVNVDGSRNVVRAARAAGVQRIVFTSSAAAIGEPAGSVGREDSVHRGHYLSAYERSKHAAERVVLIEAPDLAVVVSPSSVQGPGRATGTGKLILALLNGNLPALVDTRFSIVDIDDCARGHLLAEERGVAGERYILSGFTVTAREGVGLLEQIAGCRLPVRFLPGWLAMGGAVLVEMVSRLAGRPPRLCREMLRTLLHGHSYDGSRATRELGLTYAAPEDTLRRLVAWFRQEGLLT